MALTVQHVSFSMANMKLLFKVSVMKQEVHQLPFLLTSINVLLIVCSKSCFE